MQIITTSRNIKRGDVWSGYFEIENWSIEGEKVSNRGTFSAGGGAYPTTGGSGASGAILAGDYWTITTGGTIGDKTLVTDDIILAVVDTPGTTDSKWSEINPVDVTGDDWMLNLKNNNTLVVTLSTDNGYLTTADNRISYELPETVTVDLDPQLLYGELFNDTSKQTLFGLKTAVEDSNNV